MGHIWDVSGIFLGHIPDKYWTYLENIWEMSGSRMRQALICLGYIWDMSRTGLGHALDMSYIFPGLILDMSGTFPGTFLGHVWDISKTCGLDMSGTYLGYILSKM